MQSPIKILLVQLFSNGDCLYATAVARQIKQDYPGCRLTWAVAPFCRAILEGNPFVDEIMPVDSVPKNDEAAFRRLVKELKKRREAGEWDELFITHIMGDNQAHYDGCIRSAVFRGYKGQVIVPVTPVLRLSAEEKEAAHRFAQAHRLQEYRHIILFEFAPQSGQSAISREWAIDTAAVLAGPADTCIILSSAQRVDHPSPRVIDGSTLSLRATAALTHYCTLLLGCSSGISWINTSDAARGLPMVQLLNPDTTWFNPMSRDFGRYGLDKGKVTELLHFDQDRVVSCMRAALADFAQARQQYHEEPPLRFNTTRDIVYNLLCYLSFRAIATHIAVNVRTYGHRWPFYREVAMGFIIFPVRLISNRIKKRRKRA